MHVRRKFVAAAETKDPVACAIVLEIQELYRVELEARVKNLAGAERLAFRQVHAQSVLDRLDVFVKQAETFTMPKSLLGRALTYFINQRASLRVPYEQDGRLEIDNGEVERQLRSIAVGRKAWLFCGNDKGAERAAVVMTVVTTAQRAGANPQDYLVWLFDKIAAGARGSAIGALLPDAFVQQATQKADA